MGECGCGKTELVRYLCAWSKLPLLTLNVHGGTTEGRHGSGRAGGPTDPGSSWEKKEKKPAQGIGSDLMAKPNEWWVDNRENFKDAQRNQVRLGVLTHIICEYGKDAWVKTLGAGSLKEISNQTFMRCNWVKCCLPDEYVYL